jgi:hypothetical protein
LVETKKDMIFIFDKSSDLTDAFFSKSVWPLATRFYGF